MATTAAIYDEQEDIVVRIDYVTLETVLPTTPDPRDLTERLSQRQAELIAAGEAGYLLLTSVPVMRPNATVIIDTLYRAHTTVASTDPSTGGQLVSIDWP